MGWRESKLAWQTSEAKFQGSEVGTPTAPPPPELGPMILFLFPKSKPLVWELCLALSAAEGLEISPQLRGGGSAGAGPVWLMSSSQARDRARVAPISLAFCRCMPAACVVVALSVCFYEGEVTYVHSCFLRYGVQWNVYFSTPIEDGGLVRLKTSKIQLGLKKLETNLHEVSHMSRS